MYAFCTGLPGSIHRSLTQCSHAHESGGRPSRDWPPCISARASDYAPRHQRTPDALYEVVQPHGASGIGYASLWEAYRKDAAATCRETTGEFAHLQMQCDGYRSPEQIGQGQQVASTHPPCVDSTIGTRSTYPCTLQGAGLASRSALSKLARTTQAVQTHSRIRCAQPGPAQTGGVLAH